MDNDLAMGQASGLWDIGGYEKSWVGRLFCYFCSLVVDGFTNYRNIGRGQCQLYRAGDVDGLGFTFINGSYNGGVFYGPTTHVDNATIGLYQILAQGYATSIAYVATVNVGGGLSTYGANIALESTCGGATYQIGGRFDVFVGWVYQCGKFGGLFWGVTARNLGNGVFDVLA